ncbi:MAG TPA: hypothetical protein VHT73_07730 [Thermodesulfobacteriota bacterium]|nr:hypothetical protein [Thermodesulfobacteriota bacterium]
MPEGNSFLEHLLKKKAYVIGVREQTGKNVDSAIGEVDRQIKQVSNLNNPITGEGVTKSGPQD